LRPNAIEDLIDEKEYEYVSGRMLEVYRFGKAVTMALLESRPSSS
jgi:diphthamide biosynthesis methyltransferase